MSENSHADAVAAQLRQAARDGDLPDEIAERAEIDAEESA